MQRSPSPGSRARAPAAKPSDYWLKDPRYEEIREAVRNVDDEARDRWARSEARLDAAGLVDDDVYDDGPRQRGQLQSGEDPLVADESDDENWEDPIVEADRVIMASLEVECAFKMGKMTGD